MEGAVLGMYDVRTYCNVKFKGKQKTPAGKASERGAGGCLGKKQGGKSQTNYYFHNEEKQTATFFRFTTYLSCAAAAPHFGSQVLQKEERERNLSKNKHEDINEM